MHLNKEFWACRWVSIVLNILHIISYTFQAGRISGALTSALDVLPTLTALGQGRLPGDRHYDGKDMASVINGTSDNIREVSCYKCVLPFFTIRPF